MRVLLSFIFSFSAFAQGESFVHFMERNKVYLSTTFISQTVTLETEESNSSDTVDASFSMMGTSLNVDYFVMTNIAIHFNYYFAMILDIDAEVQGFDVGAKYYFNQGASKDIEFSGSSLTSSPGISYFALLNGATKNFQFAAVSLKFQGFEAGLGADWHVNSDFFIRGEASYEMLLNNNIRSYTGMGFAATLGYKF